MNLSITIFLIAGLAIQLSGTNQPSCHPPYHSYCIDDAYPFGASVIHSHCFLKKTYTSSGVDVVRGTVHESECIRNAVFSSLRNPDCSIPNPPVNTICYDCCTDFVCDYSDNNTSHCNKMDQINPDYMPSYMKTGPGPTVDYFTNVTTTWSPTTMMTVPTTVAKTTTSGPRCLSCTEDANNRCLSLDYVDCVDRPYCLNEVIYTGGNWTRTNHRCASRGECFWDYWIGTRSDPMCDQTGVCTYCCQTSGDVPCNLAKEKPVSLTDFGQQPEKVHTCMVTDDQNRETTHNCTQDEGRFCMNLIHYAPWKYDLMSVTKECASEDKCRRILLMSRKRHYCFNENMLPPGHHTLNACTYCCESNDSVPCNVKPIPNEFLQSVTTSETTTSTTEKTQLSPGTKCLACNEDPNTPCSAADNVDCGDRPYCLNEVIYSGGKWTRTHHRCASRVECYWDYWISTRSNPTCDQRGVCTYCCQSSGDKPCNQNKEKPVNLSDFNQQQNLAHTCMVTDHQNGETTHDCTEKEGRFCINNVYYDTRTNIPTYVTKRCASEDECRGLFLMSRDIEACITGNMTGVLSQAGPTLLCHYCCESNGNVPCNGKPRPDQIEQFVQTTTTTKSAVTVATGSGVFLTPGLDLIGRK